MNESESDWEAKTRIFELADRILRAQFNLGFANLSSQDRYFYCVYTVELEVENGGLYQLMVNAAPEVLREIPRALRDIKAPKTADIIERSYGILFGQLPETPEQSKAALARVTEEQLVQLGPLDEAFYMTEEQLSTLLLAKLIHGEEDRSAI